MYKDGRLDTVKPLGNSILHPDATGNNDGTDGSTPAEGNFTFSRGSNLAATRVDVNGLIEKGRENLLLQSNQFDTTWINGNSTETGGQPDKDGGNTAWLLTKTNSGGYLHQNINPNGVQTFSVYAKAGTLNWIRVRSTASSIYSAYFDLSGSGSVGTTQSTIDAKIESIGNGWFRCSIAFNDSIINVRIYPADADNDTSGTSGNIYIQNAQVESGLVATDYIETGASTAQAGILEDMPRLDYSGGASCPSLLLEPSRTNFVTDSEYFAGLNLYGSINATYGAYTNPSGQDSAYLLEATSAISRIQTLSSTGDGNDAVMSIFIKGNDNVSYPTLANQGGGQYTRWEFDANNVLTYYDGDAPSGDYGQEDYGNGWYRIWLKTDTINGSTNYYRFNPDNRYGTGSLYAWGFQVEKNASYHTSYIPTYGSSVTRSAEDFPKKDLYYGNKFSLFFDMNGLGGSASNNFIIRFGAISPIYLSVRQSDKKLQFYSPASGVGYFATTATQKIAISCDGTNWIWSSDGQSGSLTANGSNDGEYIRISTNGSAGGGFPSVTLNQILLFETALTADELNALTTL